MAKQESTSPEPSPTRWVAGDKFGNKRCRDAAKCTNARCGFAHPETWKLIFTDLEAPGEAESLPEPSPTRWVAGTKMGDKRCRDAAKCTNAQCGFAHPETRKLISMDVEAPGEAESSPEPSPTRWVAGDKFGIKRCQWGLRCTSKNCGFAHPVNWKYNANSTAEDGAAQAKSESESGKQGKQADVSSGGGHDTAKQVKSAAESGKGKQANGAAVSSKGKQVNGSAESAKGKQANSSVEGESLSLGASASMAHIRGLQADLKCIEQVGAWPACCDVPLGCQSRDFVVARSRGRLHSHPHPTPRHLASSSPVPSRLAGS